MATIAVTPTQTEAGSPVVVTGNGFNPAAVVTVSVPEQGISSEITADQGGYFGTDDIADHAFTTLTSDATNVTADDTVTVGAVTYTFKAAPTTGANEVKIGANAAATLANLKKAINLTGVSGTDYGSATVVHPTVTASTLTATTLLLVAKTGGTGGNSLVSTEASTHLAFTSTVFAGGSAASGVSALILDFERPGTYTITATDGTNSAQTTVSVFTK